MALIIADRVKETSSTNGASNITLSGAVTGFQSFSSAIGIGNTCYYVIENPNAGEWEVGIGTISDATTLVRTTILKSSNSDSIVTFTSGTKNVFVSFPADQIADLATLDGIESLTNKTLSTDTTWNGNVITGQYGGTGVANTDKIITIGGNLTTSGAFATTLESTANTSVTLPTTGTLATLAGSETFTNKTLSTNTTWNGNIVTGQYGGTGVANTGKTITIGGNLTTSGAFTTTITSTANTSVTLPTTGTLATLAGIESLTNKTLSTNVDYNGNVVVGQYGGTGIANTGKTITIGGNLTTSGAFTTTLTATANTSVTLPTTGTLATLAGTESLSNKYITTSAGNTTVAGLKLTSGTNTTAVANGSIEFDNTNYYFSLAGARKVNAYLDSNLTGTWSGTVVAGQYGGTGVANTGKTITIGGNLTTSGAFTTTLTSTANTSVILPITGTLTTLAGSETLTNKTLSTNTTWNGNVVVGQYGGTGVANTGKTITIGGNLTTSGAFTTTLTATANTSVTLPTTGTLATLAGGETITNKIFSTNTTWNGNVIPGQYGGTGIANTGFTLTMAGNVSHAGAFTQTLTATANTSITLPTTGTLATLAGTESLSNKYITTSAGNTTVAGLKLTSGTNTTAVANGSIEFDNVNYYFSLAGARKTVAYLDSNLTGTWSGTVVAGQYGGTGVANTGKTITIGGNLTTSGAFTTTLTSTGTTSVTLPTAGTLATLAGPETLTNKTLSTNTTWNGNVVTGQYGGTGVANTGKTITIGGNLTTSGSFDTSITITAGTSITLPTAGTLATLAGSETLTNKTLSTNTTWNGNVIPGQYGGTGVANTGKTITIGGNLTTSGAFTTTLTSTANTSITLPTTGTLATLAGTESFSNKYITTGAGNTTVAGLVLTSGTNTTAVANGSIEFDNVNYYFSVAGARKVNAYLDSNLTGTWSGTTIAGQYGGTGVANTGKTITVGGNFTTSGAFTTTLTATANTSVTLPTTGTLSTLAGIESFTNKTMSTNTTWNGNVIPGQYGGTGIANTGFTLTMAGNISHAGAFAQTFTATGTTSVTLPTAGTLATLAGSESFTNKTLSTNTTWNGNVIAGQYGGTGAANTGKTITIGGNLTTSGAFDTTLTSTAATSVTLPTTGTLATLAGIESFTNKTLSTNTTWNGNVVTGQYGGTGVANTGKTITIGGNLTTSGAFDTTLTSTATTSVTLPTAGTLATLNDVEILNDNIVLKGAAWLWGSNDYGGLGDNTGTARSSPVQTITGGSNWKQASCGFYSTAAIKTDGTLWGWGHNNDGQLGDGTRGVPRYSPVQTIIGGNNWKQVSRGKQLTSVHTAAVKTDGTLWTWGCNTVGQLGDDTTTSSFNPKTSPEQTITGGTNWHQVSCGLNYTAAIKADGTLWTWGTNASGQLGDNTTTNRSSPVQTIAGGANWKQVSCGYYATAAVKTDGTLWLWGLNSSGQLGVNSTANRSSPVQTIAGGTDWSQVSCGDSHTACVKTDGTLWLWGLNSSGQLGENSTANRSSPVQTITGGTNWKQVSCGQNTAAVKTDGTLWLWGGNSYGRLGDNTTVSKSSPVQTIIGGDRWLSVSTGGHALAIATDVFSGDKGGTGVANTGKTITIGGNLTTSGAFTTTLTSTANTSVILPTTGTLATIAGTETLSNKTVNLAAGNATTAPLKFASGTNMTAAAAGNMEFDGTRLYFSPSTTRQTVAFLTDITGGLTVANDTTTNATRYLVFTSATSGSVSTANVSSTKLYFNPSTGDLTAGGNITALSDRTLKSNITTISDALNKVVSLRGVEFDWIESGGHGIGVIAQEVEEVIPEVVLTHMGLKSVAYGNLIAVLIEAIKDQNKRIKLLEALVERFVK